MGPKEEIVGRLIEIEQVSFMVSGSSAPKGLMLTLRFGRFCDECTTAECFVQKNVSDDGLVEKKGGENGHFPPCHHYHPTRAQLKAVQAV